MPGLLRWLARLLTSKRAQCKWLFPNQVWTSPPSRPPPALQGYVPDCSRHTVDGQKPVPVGRFVLPAGSPQGSQQPKED